MGAFYRSKGIKNHIEFHHRKAHIYMKLNVFSNFLP